MSGDLGSEQALVHDEAQEVLDFWFAIPMEKQFGRDAALDAEIAARFGALRDELCRTNAAAWRDDPDSLLAAIVVLDQFSRNIYRDSAEAFAADPLAVELCRLAIERGWESRYATEERAFLYMPLMHAEDIALQRLSVTKFAELGGDNLPFAIGHLEVIARFGRFPTRNDALGRETTLDERAYLDSPDDENGPPKA